VPKAGSIKMLTILKEVEVATFIDDRGMLSVSNLDLNKMFIVKRIYSLSGVPKDSIRGMHAHKKLQQIFFCLSGAFDLKVSDGENNDFVNVRSGSYGYYLPNGYWRELSNFSENTVCLVLASEVYEPDDYLYTMNEYIEWRKDA
jgi:dTDP-4-dehydrorhamnose 3,5-epimerase-like enzyme